MSSPTEQPQPHSCRSLLSLWTRRLLQWDAIRHQAPCPFFKLPVEIRLQIYKYVVNVPAVQIRRGYRKSRSVWRKDRDETRLCHLQCPEPARDARVLRSDGEREDIRVWNWKESREWGGSNPSSNLLWVMTCRQMYAESISILYSEIAFMFWNPCDLLRLASTIPQHHLNAIRSVYIENLWPPNLSLWNKLVQILSSMSSLSKLTIFMGVGRVCYSTTCNLVAISPAPQAPSEEEAVFKALREVTQPKEFSVCIGWHVSDEDFIRDAPFHVIKLVDMNYNQTVKIRGT